MKEMSKKCSTDQRFILKEITSLKIHIYFSVFIKRKNFDEIFMHQFELFVHKEQKKLVKKFVNTFGMNFSISFSFQKLKIHAVLDKKNRF